VTGLKYQTYVNLGVVDYDSSIEPYLKGTDDKDSNSFNQVRSLLGSPAKVHDLLLYNGLDSLFEFKLREIQQKKLRGFAEAYDLFHQGNLALAESEANGMMFDTEQCKIQEKHLRRVMARAIREIENSAGGKIWKKKFGAKYNIQSSEQLGSILYNELNYKDIPLTKTGRPAVNEKTLVDIDHPLAEKIIEYRKTQKIIKTYLTGYLREVVDGVIHPIPSLNLVNTYRSSYSRPNYQNVPKRNKKTMDIVRKLFIPRTDHLLSEADYSGIEVRIAACYHKDPNMIAEIVDPSRDMHRDMAKEIYLLEQDEWTKETRYCAKNGFVFAEFYGDYFAHCAVNLWNFINKMGLQTAKGVPMMEHLRSKGISSYEKFETHIKEVERRFWEDRFPVYNQWKIDWYDQYLENGYFDTLTGFRCSGLMKKNDVINYPVQCAAFHCLLWAFTEINKQIHEKGMDTWEIGEIHDAIVSDVHPDEFNTYMDMTYQIMTKDVRTHWDWITIPLDIEVECAPVNENWSKMKEIHPGPVCPVCGCRYQYKIKKQDDPGVLIIECPLCGNEDEKEK
jgi:DNA polymerase-1